MRKLIQFSVRLLAVGAVVSAVGVVADTIVYDNTKSFLGSVYSVNSLSSSTTEFGDQITLSPGTTDRYVSTIKLDLYVNHGASGNEQLKTFKLYANDGPGGAPGGLILDVLGTNVVNVPRGYNNVTLGGFSIKVPNTFTWAVSFTGVDSLETVGLLLSEPPAVGSSFDDYWEKVGSTWTTKYTPGTPYNFSMQVIATAVPEPATIQLAAMAGLGWLGLAMRRRFGAKRA